MAAHEIAALARQLAKSLQALEEGAVRARAAGRALARLDPEVAARVVSALVTRAGDPAPRDAAAIAAVGQAILDSDSGLDYDARANLYAAAAAAGLAEVTALFVAPPARRAWEEPFDKADPKLAHLTLGQKKAWARQKRDPDFLARLAAEGDPPVVRELLRNPQLTEEFVVRIAARRPCRPQTLRAIFEDRRWRSRPAVTLALARNPWLETEIGLKLLPIFDLRTLRELAADGALHAEVRASALRLARARGEAIAPKK